MADLVPGLYEKLITRGLAGALAALEEQRRVAKEPLDPSEGDLFLARHLLPLLASALRERQSGDDKGVSDEVLALFERLVELVGEPDDALPEGQPELLTAILPAAAGELAEPRAPVRPGVPLSASALLVNARDEHRVGHELARELASADRVDLICSFVKFSGLRLLKEDLRAFCERAGPGALRVLTTAYLGATEGRALDELCRLGAAVRVSFDSRRTRLHAKAWLFHRASGFSTAYVGSSNMSSAALLDGLEWNVRLSAIETPGVLDKFAATFESYWTDPEFEPYTGEVDRPRFERAVAAERAEGGGEVEPTWTALDVRPFPHQQEILDRLAAERTLHGHRRNLVVAATGTGKTVVAALDYRRARELHGVDRLLFVAHRKEILRQSLATFRSVLRDGSFGELWVDGDRPREGKHVFASIQSLSAFEVESLRPDLFDYVVVDEFHHAAADTYRRVLEHLRPRILLGLTATPERTDGKSVLEWFDGRIAAELRLWLALERGLLSPFQYFAHHDDVDLSRLSWTRGAYDLEALDRIYTGNDARAGLVLARLRETVSDVRRMRALGFCVGRAHAHYMARVFRDAGIAAIAVDADTPRDERDAALRRLRAREVNVVFAVDLFNEGVDVPEVDTVLFLRPTESATVFLQQLGRGLRLADDKDCLTVLDFVGQAHRKFRWDLRWKALTGGTRAEVAAMVAAGFPVLPPGCAVRLDRVAQGIVLENIRAALRQGRRGLIQELVELARARGRSPGLGEFLAEAMLDLEDVYRRSDDGWNELRRAAAREVPAIRVAEPGPDEERLARSLPTLLHLDDPERLDLIRRLLLATRSPDINALSPRELRIAAMLHAALWKQIEGRPTDVGSSIARLRRETALLDELGELLELLGDRLNHLTHPIPELPAEVPIRLHARYTVDEVLAAFGRVTPAKAFRLQAGVFWDEGTRTDMFFPTIHKSEKDYSPTTMYRDYAIAPDLFHWESQASTRAESAVGRRYRTHRESGSQVLLFVRPRNRDTRGLAVPYTCLGLVDYVTHTGERPMAITWGLRVPMPAEVFVTSRLTAG